MGGESRSRRESAGRGCRAAAVIALAVAAMAASVPAGRASVPRVGNGRVVVQVPSPARAAIRVITPAGSSTGAPVLSAMPGVPGNSGDPAWSANGMLLVFAHPLTGLSQIWAINAAGQGRERLTHGNVPAIDPAWSPTDRAVVFAGSTTTSPTSTSSSSFRGAACYG